MTEAQLFLALADESRLKIVQTIGCESYTVNEIAEKLNLSAVMISHHLKILRKAGVVIDNKEGRCVH
uniref:ArsR/SmtB family transcription factor n=1 Tax=Brachyspira hyodysenteriae TaxID=159 RepID=UPI0011785321